MSTSNNSSLILIGEKITIYFGIPILIAGVIGNILNLIIFLCLRTFRENSCAFYLIIMSIVSLGQLLTTFLSRIMIYGFNIDWSLYSLFFCKFRSFFGIICSLTTFTCMCLATIDQYLATCSNPWWRAWSNIKVARRLIILFIFIWTMHGIPYLFYYQHIESASTGKLICMISNRIFQEYNTKGLTLVFIGFLPILIDVSFAILAYNNVRHLAYRSVPLVRRELEKQMTTIVLIQAAFISFVSSPYLIVTILSLDRNIIHDPINVERLQFANSFAICIYYLNFASQFYIYICVSSRFRQQLIHVISTICRNWWQRNKPVVNQIIPQ